LTGRIQRRRETGGLVILLLAVTLSGCGSSGTAGTVTVSARARTVTMPAVTRTVTVAAITRTVTAVDPAATTTKTVAERSGAGTTTTASAPSGASRTLVSYSAALAALSKQCQKLPGVASVPVVKGKAARTLALIVQPRAYPLRQVLDRLHQTYRGTPRFLKAIAPLRAAADRLVRQLKLTLAGGPSGGESALAAALKELNRHALRLALRACSV
jgi:hypothetical protein